MVAQDGHIIWLIFDRRVSFTVKLSLILTCTTKVRPLLILFNLSLLDAIRSYSKVFFFSFSVFENVKISNFLIFSSLLAAFQIFLNLLFYFSDYLQKYFHRLQIYFPNYSLIFPTQTKYFNLASNWCMQTNSADYSQIKSLSYLLVFTV